MIEKAKISGGQNEKNKKEIPVKAEGSETDRTGD